MKLDAIRVVESCYANPDDDQAWLTGILDAISPLDQGAGLYAQIFRMPNDGEWTVDRTAVAGFPETILKEVVERNRAMPRELLRRLYAPGVVYARKRAPELNAIGADLFRATGTIDGLGLIASEPDGRSVIVSLSVRRYYPPRVVHQLSCLSAHLCSSLRLRSAIRGGRAQAAKAEPEAVLDANGRVVHANGAALRESARESLARAVLRMERARGALRRTDASEALQLWQGLVDGTWSLVDHEESGGKRYLLARRNEPQVRDPVAVTARERAIVAFAAMGHQNKFIAYLLGLPLSSISAGLAAARKKLAISSRSELIQRFRPLV